MLYWYALANKTHVLQTYGEFRVAVDGARETPEPAALKAQLAARIQGVTL